MIVRLILWILRFIRSMFVLLILTILLMIGMAAAGYYLLDYLVEGEPVEVPNLYNMTKTEALETLLEKELYLKLPVDTFPSPDVPPGIVIEQRPYPGDIVKKRRAISITISTGAEEQMIPTLVGQYYDDAAIAIRSGGLELGERALVYHNEFPEGIVMAQDPMPGRRVMVGKKISLLVSQGPRPKGYVMADFSDMEITQAIDAIKPLPFEFNEADIKYVRTPDPLKWNRIIGQQPKPGIKIVEGETVQFTVASSGSEVSNVYFVQAVFNNPSILHSSDLFLMVWDETAQLFNHPLEVPIDVPPFTQEITVPLFVSGDALVILSERLPYNRSSPKLWETRFYRPPATASGNTYSQE